jgi:hypothetical protein
VQAPFPTLMQPIAIRPRASGRQNSPCRRSSQSLETRKKRKTVCTVLACCRFQEYRKFTLKSARECNDLQNDVELSKILEFTGKTLSFDSVG